MRITHKVDYGVRVVVAIARAEGVAPGIPVKRDLLAAEERVPPAFLHDILRALRTAGLLRSTRGPEGGWNLARPPADITVADVIRDLEGPLASVRGIRPHELADHGGEEPFVSLWVAVRAALRSVLDHVTIADLVEGRLPPEAARLVEDPEAWSTR
jgi:Rrf2 family protein